MDRLSTTDLINLAVETADAPMNIGAIAVLDGTNWRRELTELQAFVGGRLEQVPQLRRIIHRPDFPAWRPLWIDDPDFRIERHVHEVKLAAPGDRQALLRLAAHLLRPAMDRAHPLWKMWLVTGLSTGEVAVIFAIHHVLADGFGAMQMASIVLDEDRPGFSPPFTARAAPGRKARLRSLLAEQWRLLTAVIKAPRSSLNATVGAQRRLAVMRIGLADAKAVAHRHSAKVNDVILNVAAGGLRALLNARGDDVLNLHASVAVSLRTPEQGFAGGNRTGNILVALPAGDPDPVGRLRAIAADSAHAKQHQIVTTGNTLMMWLGKIGLLQRFSQRQRLVNLIESNLAGPPAEIRLLGAPVRALVPMGTLAGNLAIGFLALSYNGQLTITVQADAAHFPDLPVLLNAMEKDWTALVHESRHIHEPTTV